jgi:dephospho-CoA kinase
MIVIGVTGGVGTGKSTVSKMLRDLGAALIDADELAHQVILPGQPAFEDLLREFGPGILAEDGTIDRRELGRRAFSVPEGAAAVNRLIHPRVLGAIRDRLRELAAEDTPAAVLDVPLLFESGCDKLCDQVWVVTADAHDRRRRLARREGTEAGEVLSRERWQMSLDEKLARADAVIDNSGDIETTRSQVRWLWDHRRA